MKSCNKIRQNRGQYLVRLGATLAILVTGSLICKDALAVDPPLAYEAEGCVVGGRVFALHDEIEAAYPVNVPPGYKLTPYEGLKVNLVGTINAFDYFVPSARTLQVIGPCDEDSLSLINTQLGR